MLLPKRVKQPSNKCQAEQSTILHLEYNHVLKINKKNGGKRSTAPEKNARMATVAKETLLFKSQGDSPERRE